MVKRWDGVRIWYPNSLLLVQPVINMSRSDFKWEFFKVRVAGLCTVQSILAELSWGTCHGEVFLACQRAHHRTPNWAGTGLPLALACCCGRLSSPVTVVGHCCACPPECKSAPLSFFRDFGVAGVPCWKSSLLLHVRRDYIVQCPARCRTEEVACRQADLQACLDAAVAEALFMALTPALASTTAPSYCLMPMPLFFNTTTPAKMCGASPAPPCCRSSGRAAERSSASRAQLSCPPLCSFPSRVLHACVFRIVWQHESSHAPLWPLQVFLDVGTPAWIFDAIRKEVQQFFEDNPKSFTGQSQIINVASGDPMKIQLGIFFEYTHNGEPSDSAAHAGLVAELSRCRQCPGDAHGVAV